MQRHHQTALPLSAKMHFSGTEALNKKVTLRYDCTEARVPFWSVLGEGGGGAHLPLLGGCVISVGGRLVPQHPLLRLAQRHPPVPQRQLAQLGVRSVPRGPRHPRPLPRRRCQGGRQLPPEVHLALSHSITTVRLTDRAVLA